MTAEPLRAAAPPLPPVGPPEPIPSPLAPYVAAGMLLAPALGWLAAGAGRLPVSILRLELAPLLERLGLRSARGGVGAVLARYVADDSLGAARLAVLWDSAFIAAYAALFVLWVYWLRPRTASATRWLAVVAAMAALDVVENVVILRILSPAVAAPSPPWPDRLAAWASAAAAAKFALVVLLLLRLLSWSRADLRAAPARSLGALRHEIWLYLRDLARVVRPIWFPLAVVLGIAAALVRVGQAQDLVRAVGERSAGGGPLRAGTALILFSGLWAWSAWWWCRFLLTARFEGDPELAAGRDAWFAEWLPRLAALGALLGVAVALFAATFDGSGAAVGAAPRPDDWRRWLVAWGLVELAAAFLLYWALSKRRRWVFLAVEEHRRRKDVGELLRRPGTRFAIALSGGLALVLVVAYAAAPVWTGRLLGSVPTMLLAGSVWLPAGALVAVLGRRWRTPAFAWLAALIAIAAIWNDNHRLPSVDPARPPLRERLDARLTRWLERAHHDAPGEARHAMYLVATEGGGIRAAYWTAGVLGRLDEESRGEFSRRLFAVSGVSGGALGAATFAAKIADGAPHAEARDFLGRDLLAPVLGALLFPDLLQRALPPPVLPDRARALEESWEAAWRETARHDGAARMAQPFLALASTAAPGASVPVLLLNATRVESGTRVVFTDVEPDRPFSEVFHDALDGFELARSDLPLSSVAHLAARFPYVSPAATFEGGHVVDGGYFDNSGAATLHELLARVLALARERDPGHEIEPIVLVVTNGESQDAKPALLSELASPIQALLRSRTARSVHAVSELRRRVGDARCLQLGLRERDVPLPLGWMASELARGRMDDDLAGVGWASGGPTCNGGRVGEGRSGVLACRCDELVTRIARDAEPRAVMP